MVNNIQKIASVADNLDKKGEVKIASQLDSVTKNMLKIVTAQYIGVQGYWIRNKRCWDNCYRQKRASSKGKPAQEVWNECYKEYSESFNNDTSGWEKYANDDKTIKLASSDIARNKKIASLIKEKVDKKIPVPVAVYSSFEDVEHQYSVACIKLSSNLTKIASTLKDKGFNKESDILLESAKDILKEAGWTDMFTGRGNKGRRTWTVKNLVEQWINETKNNNSLANAKTPQDIVKAINGWYDQEVKDPQKLELAREAQENPNSDFAKYFKNVMQLISNWRTKAIQQPSQNAFQELSNNLYNFYTQIPSNPEPQMGADQQQQVQKQEQFQATEKRVKELIDYANKTDQKLGQEIEKYYATQKQLQGNNFDPTPVLNEIQQYMTKILSKPLGSKATNKKSNTPKEKVKEVLSPLVKDPRLLEQISDLLEKNGISVSLGNATQENALAPTGTSDTWTSPTSGAWNSGVVSAPTEQVA